jgi:hypothetical protein
MGKQSVVGLELPKFLKYKAGLTFERAKEILDQNLTTFSGTFERDKYADPQHFRESRIIIDPNESRDDVQMVLGKPYRERGDTDYYKGTYEIEEGFDHSVLNGKIEWEEGCLVELVRVEYSKR